jgi:hypothetical protein
VSPLVQSVLAGNVDARRFATLTATMSWCSLPARRFRASSFAVRPNPFEPFTSTFELKAFRRYRFQNPPVPVPGSGRPLRRNRRTRLLSLALPEPLRPTPIENRDTRNLHPHGIPPPACCAAPRCSTAPKERLLAERVHQCPG